MFMLREHGFSISARPAQRHPQCVRPLTRLDEENVHYPTCLEVVLRRRWGIIAKKGRMCKAEVGLVKEPHTHEGACIVVY